MCVLPLPCRLCCVVPCHGVISSHNAPPHATQEPCKLAEFKVASLTSGTDAVGNVTVSIEPTGDSSAKMGRKHPETGEDRRPVYTGHGTETDILVASAVAYINAMNAMMQADEMMTFRRERSRAISRQADA